MYRMHRLEQPGQVKKKKTLISPTGLSSKQHEDDFHEQVRNTHVESIRRPLRVVRVLAADPRHVRGELIERARAGASPARGPRHVEQPLRDKLGVHQRFGGRPPDVVLQAGLVFLLLID